MSSSSSSSNTKKLIAVGAVAAVGVGGALLYYKYRQQHKGGAASGADDETSFAKKPSTTTTTTTTTTAARTATSNTATTAAKPRSTTTTTTTTTNSTPATTTVTPSATAANNNNNNRAPSTTSSISGASAPSTATHSLRQPSYVDFDKYHCRVRPALGWEAVTEPSPIPTSGVILVRRPEFAEQMQNMQNMPHGSIPMVLVTIEDVSADGSTAEEVKDKTILMARQQMLMITNGMMEPQIESDKKVTDAGIFEYYIEVNQLIPGMMDMKMAVYITVKNGIAYSFQLISSPSVFRENKRDFTQMVKDFQLIDAAHQDYTEIAYLEHHMNNISVKTPPSWKSKKSIEEGVLVEFTTSSQSRPDVVTIYKGDDVHKPSVTANVKTTVVGGVTIQRYTEGASQRERRRLVVGNYTIIAVPQKTVQSPVSNNDLVTLAKSISSSSNSSSNVSEIYFVNVTDKYKCAVRDTGSIVHSILGDGSVMYFPAGIEAMREGNSDVPSVTIRCGHPDTDETCASSLQEWRQRMLQEDKSIGHIEDTMIDGKPAITFSTTDMQETGPGSSTEVKTCVHITVRQDGSTCLVRWECDTGAFRRYEKNMINFVDAFKML